jgi:hypothetical protein
MALFAAGGGLFLNEWYWDPIFHAIVWVPVVTGVALVVDLLVRFGLRPARLPFGVITGVAWVAAVVLILGSGLYAAYERPADESRAVARTLGFTAYEPSPLPRPFVLEHARAGVGANDTPALYTNYDAGEGFANMTQERRPGPGGQASAGRCLIPEVKCREVRTPKGIPVLLERGVNGFNASAVLGDTLVSVLAVDVDRAAVLAYFDSLRPVDPTEIEYSRA